VPGDVIQLEAGQRVPADLRLLTQRNLEVDESMLTGESLPVRKGTAAVAPDTPLAERRPIAYAGTHVTAGEACALVIATGNDTEVGQISSSLQQRSQLTTPLTRQFVRFSHTLLKAVLVLAALTLMVGLGRGKGLEEMVDGAIALAVGAIPEELPAIVTITLAIGVKRMARRRAIIRKLPAVETLGSTTGGNPGQHHRDLLRQNRNAHPKPHDGEAPLRRRNTGGTRGSLARQRTRERGPAKPGPGGDACGWIAVQQRSGG
jgi:magnesium-transporting ATPase (P-type)